MSVSARIGRTFYRVVKTNPPTRDDFLAHEARGLALLDEDQRELWSGVSVQATEQQARQRARLPNFGTYIAEMEIPDDGPIAWRRTGRTPGHHTLWGDPEAMLMCVKRVVPV